MTRSLCHYVIRFHFIGLAYFYHQYEYALLLKRCVLINSRHLSRLTEDKMTIVYWEIGMSGIISGFKLKQYTPKRYRAGDSLYNVSLRHKHMLQMSTHCCSLRQSKFLRRAINRYLEGYSTRNCAKWLIMPPFERFHCFQIILHLCFILYYCS